MPKSNKPKTDKQSKTKPIKRSPKFTKIDILKRALIEALEKHLGIVTSACKTAGCCRETFYIYYREDPEFKKRVDSIGEMALDFAESHLHKQIQDDNPTSTIFYLKCKGKHRGYYEKQEIEITDRKIEINVIKPDDLKDDK